jgi:Domain of unknown function (DUF6259)
MKTKIIALLLGILAFCASAYEASVDSVAYRVALWENSNPKTEKLITGKWADLKNNVGSHPECTVKLIKKQNGNDTEYRIKVTPKGNWGVAEVRYPMLFLPKLKNDYVVKGLRIGQRVPMSWYSLRRPKDRIPPYGSRIEYSGYPDVRNKIAFFFYRYPTKNTLQLMMYENDKEGVMVWTPDSKFYVKDFVMSREDLDSDKIGKGLRAYITNFPPNTGQKGTAYDSPYPVVVTPYKNGWINAARRYKTWANKQWWCKRGKIAQRKNTPKWFKNMNAFYGCAGRPGWIKWQADAIINYLDGNICGSQLMNWGKYLESNMVSAPQYMPANTPDKFQENIDLKKKGLFLAPYFMFSGVVKEFTSVYNKLKNSTIRYPNGGISTMYWTPIKFKRMLKQKNSAPPSILIIAKKVENWRKAVKKAWQGPVNQELIDQLDNFAMNPVIRKIQKAQLKKNWGKDPKIIDKIKINLTTQRLCLGSKAAMDFAANQLESCAKTYAPSMLYIDTFPHAILSCYDKSHGHPLGYAPYLVKESRNLCLRVLKKYPNMVFVNESGAGENFLDMNTVTYFKGIQPEYAIPLFQVVYNGYSRWSSWWMWPPYNTMGSFTSNMALSTHLGYLPGGAVAGGVLGQFLRKLKLPASDFKVQYFRSCMKVMKQYKSWIMDGERIGDPIVEDGKAETVKWAIKNGKYLYPVTMNSVLASLWTKTNPPKEGLLLLSNWTGKTQSCTIYGKKYKLKAYEWKGVKLAITNKILSAPTLTSMVLKTGRSSRNTDFGKVKSVSGRIVEIDTSKNRFKVRYIILHHGQPVIRHGKFFYNKDTQVENIDSVKNLKEGDKAEFKIDSKNNIKYLIFDIKGDKEEQG